MKLLPILWLSDYTLWDLEVSDLSNSQQVLRIVLMCLEVSIVFNYLELSPHEDTFFFHEDTFKANPGLHYPLTSNPWLNGHCSSHIWVKSSPPGSIVTHIPLWSLYTSTHCSGLLPSQRELLPQWRKLPARIQPAPCPSSACLSPPLCLFMNKQCAKQQNL